MKNKSNTNLEINTDNNDIESSNIVIKNFIKFI